MKQLVIAAALMLAVPAMADTFGTGDNQFTIDFVPISGDASSANGTNISQYSADQNGYREFSDPGNFRIGIYEITNSQWGAFEAEAGLNFTGSDWTGDGIPVNRKSWHAAAQFVNWLNTSNDHQVAYNFDGGMFTVWDVTDTGYDARNPFRNSNAFYFLPTEDEWVKAAYWNGSALQTYSNASASDLVSGSPDPTKWNYYPSPASDPWAVGSGSEELNGTFDMMGNVWEWVESPWSSGDYLPGSHRGLRGGSYAGIVIGLASSYRYNSGDSPNTENGSFGFRVASVPEPATVLLLALGGLALRRKQR